MTEVDSSHDAHSYRKFYEPENLSRVGDLFFFIAKENDGDVYVVPRNKNGEFEFANYSRFPPLLPSENPTSVEEAHQWVAIWGDSNDILCVTCTPENNYETVQYRIKVPPVKTDSIPANDNLNSELSPTIISASELEEMKFPDIQFAVKGYIADGLTLLAGRPKLGKSWLALDVGLAIAGGTTCLGDIRCEQGDVLYLALEDNLRRMQSRVQKLIPHFTKHPWPDAFKFATEWPKANEKGIAHLEKWIVDHPNARLVVVDVLAMFRPLVTSGSNQYQADYKAIKDLQKLAITHCVPIVVITHTRKGASESGDPFELVSGTLGLSGAADTVLVLDRSSQGATLYGRGRDIPEIESAVEFDTTTCRWNVKGDAKEVRRSGERQKIIEVLEEAEGPMSPKKITDATGFVYGSVRRFLGKMVTDGQIKKLPERGMYAAIGYQEDDTALQSAA